MRFNLLLSSLVVAGSAAGWFALRATGVQLQTQLEFARTENRELRLLQQQRDQLRAEQPNADHLARLNAAQLERTRLLGEIEARQNAARTTGWSVGEWTPSTAWANRGRSTPHAAVETALWAAAGGDVSALGAALELNDEVRRKAAALMEKMPPHLRDTYPTAEALVAGFTLKNIPLAEAQLVWLHEADRDHAAVGVLINQPEAGAPAPASPTASLDDPRLPTRLATLSLRRSETGWRLVVPMKAVDRIAAELAGVSAGGP